MSVQASRSHHGAGSLPLWYTASEHTEMTLTEEANDMSSPTLDHDAILREIRSWSAEEQLAIAREIVALWDVPIVEEPTSHSPSSQLAGLPATGATPPSDEDVARWLDERRVKKYG
jgi:hypothetical protein